MKKKTIQLLGYPHDYHGKPRSSPILSPGALRLRACGGGSLDALRTILRLDDFATSHATQRKNVCWNDKDELN